MSQTSLNRSSSASARAVTTMAPAIIAALLTGSAMANSSNTHEHDVNIVVNEIAMLDFNTATPVAFEVMAPANAGEIPVIHSTDHSRKLYFTSVVNSGEQRNITVSHNGSVPAGLSLSMQASGPGTAGMGNKGFVSDGDFSSLRPISNTAQVVVAGIGSGFTDTGNDAGVDLDYSLEISSNGEDIGQLFTHDDPVTLTYTISINN